MYLYHIVNSFSMVLWIIRVPEWGKLTRLEKLHQADKYQSEKLTYYDIIIGLRWKPSHHHTTILLRDLRGTLTRPLLFREMPDSQTADVAFSNLELCSFGDFLLDIFWPLFIWHFLPLFVCYFFVLFCLIFVATFCLIFLTTFCFLFAAIISFSLQSDRFPNRWSI